MRNAFAHGVRTIDERARTRLLRAGARMRPQGQVVTLSDTALHELRSRLSSLLNAAGIGR